MIRRYEVWNSNLQKGMGFRKIGEKEVFTFQNMRNNYYEILEDTTERFAQKVAFCDNWNREYTFCTFLQMVDDFAEYLQKVMRVKRKSHQTCDVIDRDRNALLGLFVYTGGTVYLYRRYDARRVLECILRNNITFMHGSPTVFGMLLDYQSEFPKLVMV